MTRFTLDRLRLLWLLVAALLAGSQFLTLEHRVQHLTGPGSLAGVSAGATIGSGAASTDSEPAHGGGHQLGDATCQALAHLLSLAPPPLGGAALSRAAPGEDRDPAAAAAPTVRRWPSTALARAPPLSLSS